MSGRWIAIAGIALALASAVIGCEIEVPLVETTLDARGSGDDGGLFDDGGLSDDGAGSGSVDAGAGSGSIPDGGLGSGSAADAAP